MSGRWHARLFATILFGLATPILLRGQASITHSPSPRISDANSSGTVAEEHLVQPQLPFPPVVARPPAAPVFGLPRITLASGIIFSGHVLSIARERPSGASLESVAIRFHIDRGLRGTRTGASLTIHEWAGIWSSGQRYRAGERVLLFLYPPGKLGLTSCVAGPVGRFAVDSLGRVLLSDQHLAAFRHDPILAGRSRISLDDFADAVRGAGGEERVQP